MKKYNILYLLVLIFSVFLGYGQERRELNWYNPSDIGASVVHNQLWGSELTAFYDRLPQCAEEKTRKPVWNLSRNSAGLKLVFRTNAEEIHVQYKTGKSIAHYGMNHFPATGVSGIDLFAENLDGSWSWSNGKYQFKDTIKYTFRGLELNEVNYKEGRIFHLYLPLYNSLEWLEIGIPKGATFDFLPISNDLKPILVYGTSIAQGGCASRSGMAWTNILNRLLHRPVINLGFSGNGRLEKEVVDLIAKQDPEMFILDCLPNLSGEIDSIRSKIIYAVTTIRKQNPTTPIVLVDQAHYVEGRMEISRTAGILKVNQISYDTYKDLKKRGVQDIFYLKHEDIGLSMNDSVDGTHPTDGGMLKYAKAYERLIQLIIKELKEKQI